MGLKMDILEFIPKIKAIKLQDLVGLSGFGRFLGIFYLQNLVGIRFLRRKPCEKLRSALYAQLAVQVLLMEQNRVVTDF